jgi:hypothetical protein
MCSAPSIQPQTEFEYKLMGYTPEDLPGLIPYTPPLLDLPLMTGAGEYGSAPRPAGLLPVLALEEAFGAGVPDALRQMPFVAYEIGSRCIRA